MKKLTINTNIMKTFITTVFNSKDYTITTLEIKCDNLTELESQISKQFNGWGIITAIIITFNN